MLIPVINGAFLPFQLCFLFIIFLCSLPSAHCLNPQWFYSHLENLAVLSILQKIIERKKGCPVLEMGVFPHHCTLLHSLPHLARFGFSIRRIPVKHGFGLVLGCFFFFLVVTLILCLRIESFSWVWKKGIGHQDRAVLVNKLGREKREYI